MTQVNFQPDKCPLCAALNLCAVHMGGKISDCWCYEQDFPEMSSLSQSQMAAVSNPRACICQACLVRLQQAHALAKDIS